MAKRLFITVGIVASLLLQQVNAQSCPCKKHYNLFRTNRKPIRPAAISPLPPSTTSPEKVRLATALAANAHLYAQKLQACSKQPELPINLSEALKPPTLPTDPVSFAIAYQQSLNNPPVKEDKLFYGFQRLPLEKSDCACKKSKGREEQHLFAFNGEVVELKPTAQRNDDLSQEAVDDLLDANVSAEYTGDVKKDVSLADLSYVPSTAKGCRQEMPLIGQGDAPLQGTVLPPPCPFCDVRRCEAHSVVPTQNYVI